MHLGLYALVSSIEIHPLKFNSKCERGNGAKKRGQICSGSLRALRASIVFFVCLRSLLLMYLRDFFFQEKVKNFSRSVLIFRDLNCDFF